MSCLLPPDPTTVLSIHRAVRPSMVSPGDGKSKASLCLASRSKLRCPIHGASERCEGKGLVLPVPLHRITPFSPSRRSVEALGSLLPALAVARAFAPATTHSVSSLSPGAHPLLAGVGCDEPGRYVPPHLRKAEKTRELELSHRRRERFDRLAADHLRRDRSPAKTS
jgi:hypothetical protein